ncbi:MAG: hypothetical protein WCK30_00575 [Actinomycetes bacterium]
MTKLGKLGAGIAVLLLVAGCSSKPVHAGSAARVSDTLIKQSEVTSQLTETMAQIQLTPSAAQAPDAGTIGQKIVNRLLISEIVDRALAKLGQKVTDSEVQKLRYSVYQQYGQDVVEQQLASGQGVPLSQIDAFFRTVLAQGYIGSAALPNGTDQERSNATGQFLLQFASTLEIEVAPRYGTWDPTQLQAVGVDDKLSFAQQSAQ